MHSLITLSTAVLLGGIAYSQANTKWNFINDPYYGVPSFANNYVNRATRDISGMENKVVSGAGPTGLRTEFMVNNWLGLGADAIYNQSQGKFDRTEIDGYVAGNAIYGIHHYVLTLNRFRAQVRINFHIPVKSKRLDWYGGIAFGSNSMKTSLTRDGQKTDNVDAVQPRIPYLGVSARTCLGFRYYPTKFVGIHFELGAGGPLFTTGVSTRFGFKLPQIPDQLKEADDLKHKADKIKEKEDADQKKIEDLKKKEAKGKKNAGQLKEEEEQLEKEKQQLEEQKMELERQRIELEKQQLEEQRKKLEEEKKELEQQQQQQGNPK